MRKQLGYLFAVCAALVASVAGAPSFAIPLGSENAQCSLGARCNEERGFICMSETLIYSPRGICCRRNEVPTSVRFPGGIHTVLRCACRDGSKMRENGTWPPPPQIISDRPNQTDCLASRGIWGRVAVYDPFYGRQADKFECHDPSSLCNRTDFPCRADWNPSPFTHWHDQCCRSHQTCHPEAKLEPGKSAPKLCWTEPRYKFPPSKAMPPW